MTELEKELRECMEQLISDYNMYENMGHTTEQSIISAIEYDLPNFVQSILALIQDEKTELLDALYWMYVQYCSSGHDFMNAGEDASELLENAGYIKVDTIGRIVKDYGDSREQLSEGKE